jgi:hypothetical protein
VLWIGILFYADPDTDPNFRLIQLWIWIRIGIKKQHIEIFWKKVKKYVIGIDTDPDRPDPDPNRQNDADPTRSRSGSTTLYL